jgi:hypothetical protein
MGELDPGRTRGNSTACAVRLDRSLRRDFIAGYAVSAAVMWVYPLPEEALGPGQQATFAAESEDLA